MYAGGSPYEQPHNQPKMLPFSLSKLPPKERKPEEPSHSNFMAQNIPIYLNRQMGEPHSYSLAPSLNTSGLLSDPNRQNHQTNILKGGRFESDDTHNVPYRMQVNSGYARDEPMKDRSYSTLDRNKSPYAYTGANSHSILLDDKCREHRSNSYFSLQPPSNKNVNPLIFYNKM